VHDEALDVPGRRVESRERYECRGYGGEAEGGAEQEPILNPGRCVAQDGPVGVRRAAALTAGVALVAPASAGAHIRSGIVAGDYTARVLRRPSVVEARLDASDLAVRLAVQDGHSAVVLGPKGEPFVRLGPGKPQAVWHDRRVFAARWTLPLLVDGTPARLVGATQRVGRPAVAGWLLPAFAVVLVLPLAYRSRRAATGVAVLASAATAVIGVAFALGPYASAGSRLTAGDELLLAVAALLVLARGPRTARSGAIVALGLLALVAGGLKVDALLHGVVFAALPDALVRVAVAVALGAGAAAVAFGCALLTERDVAGG
jgi:hypothetical protein